MNEKIDVLEALAGWCNETGIGAIEYARRSAVYAAVAEMIEALNLIAFTDSVDAALDPDRAVRVARASLARIGNDA